MKDLLLKSYEFTTAMLPFFGAFWLLSRRDNQAGTGRPRWRVPLTLAFALYLFAVFFLTGAGTLYHGFLYRLEFRPDLLNLMPLSREIDITGYLQNALLFMPLGFLLPLLWPGNDRPFRVVCSGFALSLLVELSQMLNNRRTDIDDLLLNTLGTLLGFLIYRLFARGFKRNVKFAQWEWEPCVYIGVMFLGRFFLFNEFGMQSCSTGCKTLRAQ